MVRFGIGIVLFVFSTLSLPPPGTSSREREFCGGWLRLNAPERVQVLRAAESEESTGGGVLGAESANASPERNCRGPDDGNGGSRPRPEYSFPSASEVRCPAKVAAV